MADDAPTLTPEERAAISHAWHILIEDKGTLTNAERAGIGAAWHLLQQDMARGGAARADDGALTEEELHGIRQGWRALVEDHAHGGKLHYSPVPVRGMPAPGSFRIPRDVFEALGDGDLKFGGAVAHAMFGIEDDPEDPTVIHPHAVRIIGNGNINTGRRVLEKFVARVRQQSRDGVTLVHDGLQHEAGHHGWRVRR